MKTKKPESTAPPHLEVEKLPRVPHFSPFLGEVGTKRTNPRLPTKRRGEVAEAAFLHKAASLGFSVAKPWGESDRYDFILDNGFRSWRVQVKSAHTSAIQGYTFHACGNVPSRRYTKRDIDFIVGYVVPDDVWYVLPIELFVKIGAVKVFPSSRRRMSKFEKYREAWCLMACPNDGQCRQEIDLPRCCQREDGAESSCPKAITARERRITVGSQPPE